MAVVTASEPPVPSAMVSVFPSVTSKVRDERETAASIVSVASVVAEITASPEVGALSEDQLPVLHVALASEIVKVGTVSASAVSNTGAKVSVALSSVTCTGAGSTAAGSGAVEVCLGKDDSVVPRPERVRAPDTAEKSSWVVAAMEPEPSTFSVKSPEQMGLKEVGEKAASTTKVSPAAKV